MTKIDNKDLHKVDILYWNYNGVDIQDLKMWVDRQIELGMSRVNVEIGWGYYDDIDQLELIAKKDPA